MPPFVGSAAVIIMITYFPMIWMTFAVSAFIATM